MSTSSRSALFLFVAKTLDFFGWFAIIAVVENRGEKKQIKKGDEKMPCPVCGRVMCDCSPAQRGQTQEEMMKEYGRDAEEIKKESEKATEKRRMKVPESVQLDEGTARVGSIVVPTDKAKQFGVGVASLMKPPLKVVEIQNQGSTTDPYILLMLQGSDGKKKTCHPSWLKKAD